MSSVQKATDDRLNLETEDRDRDRIRERLLKNVQRTRERMENDRTNEAKSGAYVKALIRLNEFLLKEKSLVLSHYIN
jgi:hypothetical protein